MQKYIITSDTQTHLLHNGFMFVSQKRWLPVDVGKAVALTLSHVPTAPDVVMWPVALPQMLHQLCKKASEQFIQACTIELQRNCSGMVIHYLVDFRVLINEGPYLLNLNQFWEMYKIVVRCIWDSICPRWNHCAVASRPRTWCPTMHWACLATVPHRSIHSRLSAYSITVSRSVYKTPGSC